MGAMANDVWILVGFGPVLCAGSAVAFAEGRRAWRSAARVAFTRPDTNGPAGVLDVEGAERQLGMLLRRMRAYRRAPYNFASSRISNDAEFERCLDLATDTWPSHRRAQRCLDRRTEGARAHAGSDPAESIAAVGFLGRSETPGRSCERGQSRSSI